MPVISEKRRSLLSLLGGIIILVVVAVEAGSAAYEYYAQRHMMIEAMQKGSAQSLLRLEKNIAPFMESYAPGEYAQQVSTEFALNGYFAIVVRDFNMGKVVGKPDYVSGKIRDAGHVVLDFAADNPAHRDALRQAFYSETRQIRAASGELLGEVTVYSSDEALARELRYILGKTVITAAATAILLIALLLLLTRRLVVIPLRNIEKSLARQDADGLPLSPPPTTAITEISALTGTIGAMLHTIGEKQMALRESEQRFKLLAEHSPMAILILSGIEQKVVYTNPTFTALFGYTMEEVTSAAEWWPLAYPDETYRKQVSEEWTHKVEQAIATRSEILPIETIVTCKNGSMKNVQWGFVATGAQNWAFGLDLTETRQAEEALRASEEKHRKLFESMSQGVVYQNAEGLIVSANHAAERILGLTLDQMTGKTSMDPLWHAIHEDGSAYPGDTHPAMLALRTGHAVRNAVMGVFNTSNGDYNWININAVPQFNPGEKSPCQVYTTFEDITERKKLEDIQHFLAQTSNLHSSESFFEQLARYLSQSLDMFYVCIDRLEGDGLNATTLAVWCDGHFENNSTYALKDTPCGDVVGNQVCCFPASVCQYFPRDQVLQDLCAESYIGATLFSYSGQPIGLIAVIGRKPLANRPLAESILRLVAIRAAGELERLLAENELTRYKDHLEEEVETRTADLILARDAAEAANQAKSTFLTSMSHELRTPLNAILGFSSLMRRDEQLRPEQRANLDIINRSGEHLLTLINDILELAKIEAGKTQLNIAPFDLGVLVRDVSDMMELRARAKGLRLLIDQSSEFPRYINGDEARLRQILINLLGNAVKFTEQGGVTLRLGTKKNAIAHLVIEIEDSGPGISAEDQQRLFQPFMQFGKQAGDNKGTGLGLSITRQFVQMMGGTISVESTVGKGSVFRVDLPLSEVKETDLLPQHETDKGEVIGLASGQPLYRILIVEDQLENQLLLSQLMQRIGFEVQVAENGTQGVHQFQSWQPHLIFMDRRMPDMDGIAATKAIRQLPGGQDVKIVAVTASAFMEQRNEMMEAGMNDFVRKPYRFNEIYDSLTRQLGVRYTYNETRDNPEKSPPVELTAEMLAVLPSALLIELRAALESLDSERISSILQQVNRCDEVLYQTLSHLVDNFDYPAILKVLQTNGSGGLNHD